MKNLITRILGVVAILVAVGLTGCVSSYVVIGKSPLLAYDNKLVFAAQSDRVRKISFSEFESRSVVWRKNGLYETQAIFNNKSEKLSSIATQDMYVNNQKTGELLEGIDYINGFIFDYPKKKIIKLSSPVIESFWGKVGLYGYFYQPKPERKLFYVSTLVSNTSQEPCAIPVQYSFNYERGGTYLISSDGLYIADINRSWISQTPWPEPDWQEKRQVNVYKGCQKVDEHTITLQSREVVRGFCQNKGEFWYTSYEQFGKNQDIIKARKYNSDMSYIVPKSVIEHDVLIDFITFDCVNNKFYWMTGNVVKPNKIFVDLYEYDPATKIKQQKRLYLTN